VGIVLVAVIVVVGLVVAGLVVLLTGGGGGVPFPVGSRAFEAHLTLGPLRAAIESARNDLASAPAEKRDRLARELRFLEEQVVELEGVCARRDASPGKGYVGFTRLPAD